MVLDSVTPRPAVGGQRLIVRAALPVAMSSLVLGAVVLFVHGTWIHVVGYVLSCLLPFLLVAFQRRAAARMLAAEGIARPTWERYGTPAILAAGFVLAVIHAWSFAWGVS